MRKSKIINIEGVGEVTVKEISPMAVYRALTADNKVEAAFGLAEECVSLSRGQLEKLYASEIEQLVDGVKEINASFFRVADKLGVAEMIRAVATDLTSALPPLFVGLFRQGMEQEPGITDGTAS